jgi:hypothetical protein
MIQNSSIYLYNIKYSFFITPLFLRHIPKVKTVISYKIHKHEGTLK